MEEKTKIRIPKADEKEVATLPSGEIGNIKKRFEKIDQILFGVMLAVVLSMVAIIISVISMFLDQMRFNNTVYKEYSEKIQILNSSKETSNTLYQQNKQNYELILEQQEQIMKLLDQQSEENSK